MHLILTANRSNHNIKIRCDLTEEAIFTLFKHGIEKKHPEPCKGWRERNDAINKDIESTRRARMGDRTSQLKESEASFGRQLYGYLISLVLDQFP